MHGTEEGGQDGKGGQPVLATGAGDLQSRAELSSDPGQPLCEERQADSREL